MFPYEFKITQKGTYISKESKASAVSRWLPSVQSGYITPSFLKFSISSLE